VHCMLIKTPFPRAELTGYARLKRALNSEFSCCTRACRVQDVPAARCRQSMAVLPPAEC